MKAISANMSMSSGNCLVNNVQITCLFMNRVVFIYLVQVEEVSDNAFGLGFIGTDDKVEIEFKK